MYKSQGLINIYIYKDKQLFVPLSCFAIDNRVIGNEKTFFPSVFNHRMTDSLCHVGTMTNNSVFH